MNTKSTYVMLGVKIATDELPGGIWDDRWLPNIEGHEGVEISIITSSTTGEVFIGRVLASTSSDEYEEGGTAFGPTMFDTMSVNQFMSESGISTRPQHPQLMLVNIYG